MSKGGSQKLTWRVRDKLKNWSNGQILSAKDCGMRLDEIETMVRLGLLVNKQSILTRETPLKITQDGIALVA